MGTARLAREARDSAEAMARDREARRRKLDLEKRRASMEEQVRALRAEFKAHELEVEELLAQAERAEEQRQADRSSMARIRGGDAPAGGNSGRDGRRRKYGKREEVRSQVAGE